MSLLCIINYQFIPAVLYEMVQWVNYFAGQATLLWRFVKGKKAASLPATWTSFLTKHTISNKRRAPKFSDPYSTYRDTNMEWYLWRTRLQIQDSQAINNIQKLCDVSMEKLGYVPLQTIADMKNVSISFVKNINCMFWNCWAFRYA